MLAVYVHLVLEDMRDRVRRDAGVDELGYTTAMEAGDKVEQLKALLRKTVAEPIEHVATDPHGEAFFARARVRTPAR